MAQRDVQRRRDIRKLEAARDDLMVKISKDRIRLAEVRAALKSTRARR